MMHNIGMLKSGIYIVVALIIDGLQALFSLFFVVIGSMAGTLVGVTVAYNDCLAITGSETVAGACAAAGGFIGSFANLFTTSFAIPVGIMMGFVMGIVISLTLGTAFVVALAMDDMFYPPYIIPAYLGETIPGLSLLPAWTTLAILCIARKKAEEGSGVMAAGAKLVTAGAKALTGNEAGALKQAVGAAATLRQARTQQKQGAVPQEKVPRQRVELKSPQAWSDGVKPPKNPYAAAANEDSFEKAA